MNIQVTSLKNSRFGLLFLLTLAPVYVLAQPGDPGPPNCQIIESEELSVVVGGAGAHLDEEDIVYLVLRRCGQGQLGQLFVFLEPGQGADNWIASAGGIRLRPAVRIQQRDSEATEMRITPGWEFDVRVDPHSVNNGNGMGPADHFEFFAWRVGDELFIEGADHDPDETDDGRHGGQAHFD